MQDFSHQQYATLKQKLNFFSPSESFIDPYEPAVYNTRGKRPQTADGQKTKHCDAVYSWIRFGFSVSVPKNHVFFLGKLNPSSVAHRLTAENQHLKINTWKFGNQHLEVFGEDSPYLVPSTIFRFHFCPTLARG